MTDDLRISPEGVKLLNLNWGYQIIYDNLVLKAVFDDEEHHGWRRSDACTALAEHHYARICDLYQRLFAWKPKPSDRAAYALGRIIQEDKSRIAYHASVKTLLACGLVRRRNIGFYYIDLEPVWSEGL